MEPSISTLSSGLPVLDRRFIPRPHATTTTGASAMNCWPPHDWASLFLASASVTRMSLVGCRLPADGATRAASSTRVSTSSGIG